MKKTTVTIGIPAFQSESNIGLLLKSLLKQKQEKIRIQKILVYSDGSKDQTVKKAKSVKSKKIQVISAKQNRGFAYALQSLINRSNSDVFVELNDDIRIESVDVIEELVKPFRLSKKVGLVGGNIKALEPETFIGKCIYTSYLAFLPLRLNFNKGESDLTCDGKILALSKDFAKSLKLKNSKVGNVDIYFFYENLKQGRLYKFAKKAQVLFRLPETLEDFRNQERRAIITRDLMLQTFGDLFKTKHNLSRLEYFKSALKTFLRYPLKSIIFKLFINRSSIVRRRSYLKWKLALTTKKLSLLGADFEHLLKQL